MTFTQQQIILGFIVPGGFALAAFVAGWLTGWRWIVPPVLCAGYMIAFFPLRDQAPGNFHDWQHETEAWLLYLAIPLAALVTLDAIFRAPWWLRAAGLIGFWWFGSKPLLAPLIPGTLSATEAQWWMVAAAGINLIWWGTFESMAARGSGVMGAFLLLILAAGSAVMLMALWASQKSAAQAGSLAVLCGAGLMVSILAVVFRKPFAMDRGVAAVVPTLLILIILYAHLYSGDNDMYYLVRAAPLLGAPLLTFMGDLPGIRKRRWVRVIARVLPFVIAVGAVSAFCLHEMMQSQEAPMTESGEI